jgi:hypothetical protein
MMVRSIRPGELIAESDDTVAVEGKAWQIAGRIAFWKGVEADEG